MRSGRGREGILRATRALRDRRISASNFSVDNGTDTLKDSVKDNQVHLVAVGKGAGLGLGLGFGGTGRPKAVCKQIVKGVSAVGAAGVAADMAGMTGDMAEMTGNMAENAGDMAGGQPEAAAEAVPLVARTGRQRQRYEDGYRLIAGCIPFRWVVNKEGNDDVETLMITRQRGHGLVFPKGGWEDDETAEDAARREAMEEAGVRGDIQADLGVFEFDSRGRDLALSSTSLAIDNSVEKPSGSAEAAVKEVDMNSRFCVSYLDGCCRARIFALHLSEEMPIWPEQSARTRKWMAIGEAMENVKHEWMRSALSHFRKILPNLHAMRPGKAYPSAGSPSVNNVTQRPCQFSAAMSANSWSSAHHPSLSLSPSLSSSSSFPLSASLSVPSSNLASGRSVASQCNNLQPHLGRSNSSASCALTPSSSSLSQLSPSSSLLLPSGNSLPSASCALSSSSSSSSSSLSSTSSSSSTHLSLASLTLGSTHVKITSPPKHQSQPLHRQPPSPTTSAAPPPSLFVFPGSPHLAQGSVVGLKKHASGPLARSRTNPRSPPPPPAPSPSMRPLRNL